MTNSEVFVAPDRTPNSESGEGVSTSSEDTPMVPHAVHLMALAEKDAIEEAIRREADPRGMISRNSIDTAGLVKYIRKRQRDGMEERRRDQNSMRIEKEDLQHRFDDEKERLHRIIRGQNEAMRARDEQGQQICDDYCELRFKYKDLLEDNKAKDNRITELEEKAKEMLDTYQTVNQSSVEALKRADRQMEYRIDRINIKYEQELGAIRGWNQELQDRLNIARRLQPVILLHRAQVGTVCEMHEKLLQLKKSKTDELAAKENRYRARDEACTSLKSQMNILKADQRMEPIRAKAQNEGLQTSIGFLQEAKDRMDKELESWENGHGGSLRVSELKQNGSQSENEAASLAKELKVANANAFALDTKVSALQAENGVLERQLENAATAYNPQVQEQVEYLESQNQRLREAAEEAATLETHLRSQFAEAERMLGERFANRTRELEVGFDLGFENLREIRNKWFLHKRGLEEQHNREIVAEDLRRGIERQRQDDERAIVWKIREEELQRKEDELQTQKAELATQVRRLHSGGQNLKKVEARAKKAEGEVLELQAAAVNVSTYRNLTERNLNNEIESQRRDGQRHLDLLNEETNKMAEWPRLPELHSELQIANCSMNFFKFKLINGETDSEALSQALYGADFYESDVRLLQDEGRPVLLAQLQAAKWTLENLRSVLAESPNVQVDKILSILMAPRGDEDVAQPIDDIFGPSNEELQSAPQTNSRKRSGAPLGGPTYGDHEENAAPDDWGYQDQGFSTGAGISTPEDILNRKRLQPKARRNGGPAKAVPLEIIDPVIRDQ